MLRSIVAVVATYIVIVIFINRTFMGMWFGIGPDRLLEPGTWKSKLLLCIAAPAITLVGGLFGGWMCAKIGRSTKPVMVLAGAVLVLSVADGYFALQKPEPTGVRAPDMTMRQIMEKWRQPTWLLIFNPIGCAAAVLIGGLLIGAPRKSSAAT